MAALRSLLFALLFLMAFSLSLQAEKLPGKDPCRLFKDDTKLRKPGTCNEGIICRNFKSEPDLLCNTPEKPWYTLSNACAAKQPADSYCNTACSIGTMGFVADKKNCNNWYHCNKGTQLNFGTCPGNQIFDAKKQMCSYENASCVKTYDICDIVKTGVSFADENSCYKYFQCKGGLTGVSQATLICDTGLYYNAALGRCTPKAQVACNQHPFPDQVCGNTTISYRNRFVDDQASCRGYFYCKDQGVGVPDKSPKWGQCASNLFFNPKEQACQTRSHVKCNEDRCDGRGEGEKEISSKPGCQHYLICGKGGYTKAEEYCGDGRYFDAETYQCTNIRKIYGACS